MCSSVLEKHCFRRGRRVMFNIHRSLAVILCFSSLAAFAQAATHVRTQASRSSEGIARAASALHVKIEGGSIRLVAYSGDRISYVVRSIPAASDQPTTTELPQYRVASYVRGATSWLVATPRTEPANLRSIEFLVRVPMKVKSVALDTSGGDVTVHGVGGRVSIVSGGGQPQSACGLVQNVEP